ncbi:MAG: hypothetical protein DCC58_11185 [Chloroflexi bacterium]|nr:MAG: hypothetical protein DCC58_11185 [Chloroflexota bacterium]
MSSLDPELAWYVARGSGLVAYLLMAISVCLGIAVSKRWHAERVPRLLVAEAHRSVVSTLYIFIILHIVTVATHMPEQVSSLDYVVPLLSDYHTKRMALGIVATQLAFALGLSVWARKWIGFRAWRLLHCLAYPMFLAALSHGIAAGSDTSTIWGMAVYGGSILAVLCATAWRLRCTARVAVLRPRSVWSRVGGSA